MALAGAGVGSGEVHGPLGRKVGCSFQELARGSPVEPDSSPPCEPGRPRRRNGDASSERDGAEGLEPLARALATDGTRVQLLLRTEAAPPSAMAFELLIEQVVRKAAWGAHGKRGAASLELGAGEYAGTQLTVVAEGRAVAVEIRCPDGVWPGELCQRIRERLHARGLEVTRLTVL